MSKIKRAGGIPWLIENGIIKMMLMIPSDQKYGGPDPQIAKGKIEDNEKPELAAFREVAEELGLKRSNLVNQLSLGSPENTLFMYLYLMEVKNAKDFEEPCFETGSVLWITENDIEVVRELHRPLIQQAFSNINEIVYGN